MSENARPSSSHDDALVWKALAEPNANALDFAALQDLLSGVAAAPIPTQRDSWMELISEENLAEDLQDHLRRWRLNIPNPRVMPEDGKLPNAIASARLEALRSELRRQHLDGFIVPHADEHQGEYIPLRAERLAWLTGFTGSAGLAIVLGDKAAIFTDGRYMLQVRDQVDGALYEHRHMIQEKPAHWLSDHVSSGARIGYDPWLHALSDREAWLLDLRSTQIELVPLDRNPIDQIWHDQPLPPLSPVRLHSDIFSGRSAVDKRQEVAKIVREKNADAAILPSSDVVAWLLNIRGGDVPRKPLPLCFAILGNDGLVSLFIDPRKLLGSTRRHLGNQVSVYPLSALDEALAKLGKLGKHVIIDPNVTACYIADRLREAGAQLILDSDPCLLPRACKNPVEIKGAQAAHVRDGAALVKFLCWLSQAAPKGDVTELIAVEKLYEFRAQGDYFRDLSFDTIAGAGPNGAIVHYRVTPRTNRTLILGELFLLDSGAQYLDGTTDVTRTLAIGTPNPEMRDRFTRVLKGHIALAEARFPQGTTGSQLDALARAPLWQVGLDFDHGTGHGVGSYLGVHEGPQRISTAPNRIALAPGMILSDEPGYYKTGDYGIRIENLIVVKKDNRPDDERPMLGFDILTLVPIDKSLIDPNLLTEGERAWVDFYHARVFDQIAPLLDEATKAWLRQATSALVP